MPGPRRMRAQPVRLQEHRVPQQRGIIRVQVQVRDFTINILFDRIERINTDTFGPFPFTLNLLA